MRKLVYYVGISLDGYMAGPGGEIDFYPLSDDMAAYLNDRHPEVVPAHIRAMIGLDGTARRFDTVIMGRGTYDQGVASPYSPLRQYVVSSSIKEIDHPEVELVGSDPLGLVRRLKREDGMDIYLCGGGILAAQVLPEIDEMIVKLYPVVAGSGIPVFTGEFRPTRFDLADSRGFSNGATVLTYTLAN
ncbi:dihydrofolate reductase family protein [Nonomuraea sp. NPDC050556]|uniref:dihydrofolate reductase family protein n=1 Tax=Nonomuraea sp. NPDC050556 TaxID=3364369 RepID=UPI0037A7712A